MLSLFLLAPSGIGLGCFLVAAVIQTKARHDRRRRLVMENQGHRPPIHREAAGKHHHGGGRPGPATPAREAVAPLSIGRVAAMAVATVAQQATDVVLQSVGVACRATPSVFGQPFGVIPSRACTRIRHHHGCR